jgi:enoyl-CoA hydratase
MIMNYEILKLDINDNIAVLTISRPQAMNALNSRFLYEMNEMLNDLEKRNDVRALIITGEGKAFVAGADIAEMSNMNAEQGKQFSQKGQNTLCRIENLQIPVIAAVNGFALGGGCELAMACDIRVASKSAKFGQPEVNLGLTPGYAGTQRLPRQIGVANALFLLLTAEMITADEAFRLGLVQKVTEPEQLMTEAVAIATKIATKGPIAVRKTKEATRKGILTDFNSACNFEAEEFGKLFGNGESGEGMRAFLEKRKPNW